MEMEKKVSYISEFTWLIYTFLTLAKKEKDSVLKS